MTLRRVVADRFEIQGLAGAGGSASVYRALDLPSGQTVALKVLRAEPGAEAIERFALEARVLAELSHPGIVRYVTHGHVAGELFLAMEWLEGMTLAQRLAKSQLTIDESVAIVRATADALGSAHKKGIVHRDVKPANIFLIDGDASRLKVLDFGIARLRTSSTVLTQAGMVVGTPGYMAPEQARGQRDLDARADVFSLGCLFHRCLTGRNPFAGDDIIAVLAKVLLEEAPRVRASRPEISAAIDQLVATMLAKRPSDRPADADAVSAALAALEPAGEVPMTTTEGPSLGSDERRMMCILLSRAPKAPEAEADTHEALRAAVASQGGHLDVLADRSLLVTLEGKATPTDSAARAARCALAIRAKSPELPVVLVAGEGEMKGRVAMGPVIDRGAALLAAVRAGGAVQLDDVMARLLEPRFEVRAENGRIALLGERDEPSTARTFLGKPSLFVGRERDLATLEATWSECVDDGVARIVLVTGPAGIGKSRLLDEVLKRVRDDEPEVWMGRGDPMSARAPFAMIADPIRQAAGIRSGDPPGDRQAKLARRVERIVPREDAARVAAFLAEIIGTPFGGDTSVELRAARSDPQLMGDQMRRAWEDWLDAESRAHPILIVLEDLHWGDLPSIKFVDSAMRHLERRPIMVLALARPDLYEWAPDIWRERSLTELRLGRLGDKAAARLVREALGDRADETTIARLVERGEGNAFFLEELVRAIAAGKGEEIPDTVLAMVQARLAALSADARRFMRAASVFGKIFSSDGVMELLGADAVPARLAEWISELVERDVVRRPGEAQFQGELAFHHALIQEAAYSMLTEADRTLGHKLAAEWLERRGDTDAVVLAEHFERGGELGRAVGWYWRAAEQALEGNDCASAVERVERAIRCGARGEDEGALRLIESEARRWRGENAESRTAARLALKGLPVGSPGWCSAASELAAVSGSLGDAEGLVALAGDLERVEPVGGSSQLVNALARLARPLFWAGKHELASRILARAGELERASPGLQPTALTSLSMARGVEARLRGDPSECVRQNQLAVAASMRAGDLRGNAAARGNLGYAYLEIGAFAEAERALAEALATATRLGLPLVVATAQQNLGLARARRGAVAEGLELERASFETFEAQGDFRRAGCSLLYRALIEIASGALDDADRTARRAAEMLRPNEPLLCYALALLASVELARGDAEAATADASEARALFEKLGNIDEGESRVRLVHAETLYAGGHVETARAAMSDALDRLLERAANIDDERLREDFLSAIPENARTIELARAWGVAPPAPG